MAEIIDIITNIELIAHDEGARKAATAILNLTHEVENLGKKRETLAAKQKFQGNQDVETQKRILHEMQKVDAEIRLKTKLIINERIANSDLNKEIVKELGYLGNLQQKLQALKNQHAFAETAKEARLVTREIQKLEKEINTISGKSPGGGGLLQNFLIGAGIGSTLAVLQLLGRGISDFIGGAVEEFEDAEKSTGELKRSLDVLGKGEYFDELIVEADRLAKRYHNLFDNDDIVKAQTALIRYGKLTRDELSKLTPVIIELATAERIDLVQATEKVVNILEGRGGQTLRDYGLSVKGVKSEHDRLNLVLNEFQAKLTGTADVYAQTAEGLRKTNDTLIKNVEERFGQSFVTIRSYFQKLLLPVLERIAQALKSSDELEVDRIEGTSNFVVNTFGGATLTADQKSEVKKRIASRGEQVSKLEQEYLSGKAKLKEKMTVAQRDKLLNRLGVIDFDLPSLKGEIDGLNRLVKEADNRVLDDNAKFNETKKKADKKAAEVKYFTAAELLEKFKQQTEKEFNENLKLREEFNQKELYLIDALNATGALTEQEYHDLQLERQLKFFEEQIIFYQDYGKDVYKIRQDQLKALAELEKNERAKNKAIIEKEGPVNSPFPGGATGGMDISDQPASVFTPEGEKAMIDSGKAIKNNNEEIIKSFQEVDTVIQSVGNSIMQVTQIQIDSIDKEISAQQNRIDRAKKYAERGGAELLEIEEERLARLEEKREKYARRQLQINSVLALSNAILAVATAAGETGVGAIAAVPAVIAAIAAGYAVVASFDEPTSFAGGTKSVEGPGTETSDSVNARVSKGEFILPAKKNRAFKPVLDDIYDGVFANHADMVAQIQAGKYNGMNYKAVIESSTTNTTNNKDVVMAVDRLNTTLENHPVSKVIFDERGFGSYLVKQQARTLKRNKY